MELFNDSGFDPTDKVTVTIGKETYTGTVIKIDTVRKRIKVDYTAKSDNERVKDWFAYSFWTKTNTNQ